jgi:hypothetical protein
VGGRQGREEGGGGHPEHLRSGEAAEGNQLVANWKVSCLFACLFACFFANWKCSVVAPYVLHLLGRNCNMAMMILMQ